MKLLFATVNSYKAQEVVEYTRPTEVEIVSYQIREILSMDLDVIVRDKALKAYEYLGMPCVVEHGGLSIQALDGLPGGLSKPVWDTLDGRLCDLIPSNEGRGATAMSVVGYCDGRRISLHRGETSGMIADARRGDYDFQWDPIFVPEGTDQTFGEMGFPAKAAYSAAAKAWSSLLKSIAAE